eukprot:3298080-Pleurochrysis_carterae.AAC.3
MKRPPLVREQRVGVIRTPVEEYAKWGAPATASLGQGSYAMPRTGTGMFEGRFAVVATTAVAAAAKQLVKTMANDYFS